MWVPLVKLSIGALLIRETTNILLNQLLVSRGKEKLDWTTWSRSKILKSHLSYDVGNNSWPTWRRGSVLTSSLTLLSKEGVQLTRAWTLKLDTKPSPFRFPGIHQLSSYRFIHQLRRGVKCKAWNRFFSLVTFNNSIWESKNVKLLLDF